MTRSALCVNCITPPHLLKKLLESSDRDVRDAALVTLLATAQLRGERNVRALAGFLSAPADGRRTIYDCKHSVNLSLATIARTEDGNPSRDVSVNRAFDGFGDTREFLSKVFDRESIDDRGMRLDGYVHRGVRYNNAFWDGQQMVFGDGDGIIFTDFTSSLDVIAHELAHGVTEWTANLEYHNQPGALNESMSDVIGSMVKQWSRNETADTADWLIGAEVFTPAIGADALRSMKAPGTAYNNSQLGSDPQPDHMDQYVQLPDTEDGDWGGVHINSGIPNKAFYLVATAIGGHSWETAGQIWYASLLASHQQTKFQEFADTTYAKAAIFGTTSQQIVAEAWAEVGITVSGTVSITRSRAKKNSGVKPGSPGNGEDICAGLAKQVERLTKRLEEVARAGNGR